MKRDFGPKKYLVFYSGGAVNGNAFIHKALADIKGKKARSITYIPYTHENGRKFFDKFKKRYKKFGFQRFRYFACDTDYLAYEMRDALRSDVIYLAGGNTFYFLKHLRESGMLDKLKRFVERGGVLAGLSAGAIIMTSNIRLAGYPPHEGDENEVRLKNLAAMNLVDFEFLPHFTNSQKTNDCMLRYSRRHNRHIFACPDGSGVVVSGHELRLIGPVYLFLKGRRIRLN